MLINLDVHSWPPAKVQSWLMGLRDDADWIDPDRILTQQYDGRKLLLTTSRDLDDIGAKKVDLQEKILEAIERLRFYDSNINRETLQTFVLRLANKSRALQKQLVANRTRNQVGNGSNSPKCITLSKDLLEANVKQAVKQRVDLDTLAYVSAIVGTVQDITYIISRSPFSEKDDYRSMKSLILALSIELTSTAQRDQFVERPNDILEKSSKALADYCDHIVHATKDFLLIQPFQMRTVRVRKGTHDHELGLVIRSRVDGAHYIAEITPLSPAKKTNELHVGDEVIYFNQFVIGWSARKIQTLMASSAQLNGVTLIVVKKPSD